MIKIENLKLEFPGRLGLSIDELSIEEGRILAVIGPNGAGKTTLLNIIALFQKADDGSIQIWGEDILKLKCKLNFRRRISFIFSQPYLFNQTVYNNIALPLRLRGGRDAQAVDEMLDLFKIGRFKMNMALTLSQGEKHRVALARAFVTRPKLLLLDEPFLSLDRVYKESLINDLRKVIKHNETTVICVTQDHNEALSLADTMAVMKGGRILQYGRPQDIFTLPVSKEAADFVGMETIIEGSIIGKKDNLCFVRVMDKTLAIVSACDAGEHVFVCVRPQDVVVSRVLETNSARNHFKAIIRSLEPWGLGYKLTLNCGFDIISFLTKQSIEDLRLKYGQEVFFSFKATAPHLIKRQGEVNAVIMKGVNDDEKFRHGRRRAEKK